jgi:hypothetical protein
MMMYGPLFDDQTLRPMGELGRRSTSTCIWRAFRRRVEDIPETSGHAGQPEHRVEPQQEDLREDGGAEPANRRRPSVSLSLRTAVGNRLQ